LTFVLSDDFEGTPRFSQEGKRTCRGKSIGIFSEDFTHITGTAEHPESFDCSLLVCESNPCPTRRAKCGDWKGKYSNEAWDFTFSIHFFQIILLRR